MTINDVFNVCRERGVHLVITGNELRAQGRKGAVHDALRNGLAKHKQAIIDAAADGISLDELRIIEYEEELTQRALIASGWTPTRLANAKGG
jgi:hypothetical protein